MKRVRILFAGTTFTMGGAERVFSHLAQGLHRPPFDVEVLALREPGVIGEEFRTVGIPLHSGMTGAGRLDPFLLARLHRFLGRGGYDAVYFLDHAHAVFYGVLASLNTKVRVRVMPVHTTGQWGGRPSLRRPIRAVSRWLDRVIAIAEAQRDYLVEHEGVPREKVVVIPNGIPVETPGPETRRERRRAVRQEFGLEEDVFLIGITAVLRPEKNHELLLNALARLRPMIGDPASPTPGSLPSAVQLWIVGDGPRRGFLEAEASRLGLSGAVRFLGRRNDVRRILPALDVAVLSSHPRVETLPLSLLEAMDAGLPVVATRVGALHEMVDEGRSGLLVEAGDAEGLTGALLRLLADPGLREAMGAQGQRIVREKHSVEKMVDQTAELLLRLLGT